MESARQPEYPEGKIIGTFEAGAADAAIAALTAAGFTTDQVDVITAADIEGIDSPLDRPGVRGFVDRLLLSLGGDLTWLEQARQELATGHVLVAVEVEGDDAKHRVRDILRYHRAHSITYFGRWTITSLE
jgi:hypothetical protein